MKVDRKPIFDAAKRCGAVFRTLADVRDMDAAIDLAISGAMALVPVEPAPTPIVAPELPEVPTARVSTDPLTVRVALELIEHEAIVQEAYLDSANVWTWGVGVTSRSGHKVHPRYKDKPQTIRRCLEIYIWLLRRKYIPAVLEAFAGHALTEAQFAAALSFHYNTGAISGADWCDLWKSGKIDQAREAIMNWRKPPEIKARRAKERDLFFDGKWSQDGFAVVFPVSKTSYRPNFRAARHVDVRPDIEALL